MNYSSSSCISNVNGIGTGDGSSSATSSSEICTPEVKALHILSQNIHSLISVETHVDFSDAQITVGEHVVPVHRCILGVRSPFFRNLFSKNTKTARPNSTNSTSNTGEGLQYELKELLGEWNVGYEAFMIVLGYLYSGKLAEPPSGVCTCVDRACSHDACRPAIDFALELLYSAYVFQIPELVSLSQTLEPVSVQDFVGRTIHTLEHEGASSSVVEHPSMLMELTPGKKIQFRVVIFPNTDREILVHSRFQESVTVQKYFFAAETFTCSSQEWTLGKGFQGSITLQPRKRIMSLSNLRITDNQKKEMWPLADVHKQLALFLSVEDREDV
ncbi:hypothetical protein KI387_030416, partial [Taxus chinensis]